MKATSLSGDIPLCRRDALTTSLRRIDTIAALLQAPGSTLPCEPLPGVVVADTAGIIAFEAARLRELLALPENQNGDQEGLSCRPP